MTADPTGGSRTGARVMGNRLVAAVAVPVALAHIALTGKVRPASAGRIAAAWARLVGRLTGVTFQAVGRLGPASGTMRVIVANHSSPLDIAALLAVEPDVTFVAAAELFRVPLLAAAMRALRTVPVDRRSRTGVHLALPAGLAGPALALTVFPEGGIAPPGRRLPFRRSPFALAVEHGATLVPVAIHSSERVLPPRSALGVRPGTVTVEFLPPIATAGRSMADRGALCEMAEHRIAQALANRAAEGPDRSVPARAEGSGPVRGGQAA